MAPPEKRKSISKATSEDVTLEEALDLVGFGRHNCLAIFVGGLNVSASIFTSLVPSLTIPAADCDLNLTVGEKGFLTTIMFTGMIFTSHLFGYLADEYGRKYVALRCNLASSFLSLVSAFCPNFITMATVMFMNGAVTAGVLIPAYVFVGENVRIKYRSLSILLCGALGNTGAFLLPALGIVVIPMQFQWDVWGYYTFTSWRMVLVFSAVLPLLGSAGYLVLNESPKYLLTSGLHDKTLKVLQHMFALNTGRPKEEFPVKNVRLDATDLETTMKEKNRSIKRIWIQTLSLFRKPLLKLTVMSSVLQAGLFGACNMVYLWVPELVTKMINYATTQPEYDMTFCEVFQSKGDKMLNVTVYDVVPTYETIDELMCEVNVPIDMYYVTFAMGVAVFCVFLLCGALAQVGVANKTLLIIFTFFCAATCFSMTFMTNLWLTIVTMAGTAVLLEACLPISIGIVIEYFPTRVRSTASCLCMVCGRITTSIGTLVMGLMQEGYCDISYWGLAAFIVCIAIIALILPDKKKMVTDSKITNASQT